MNPIRIAINALAVVIFTLAFASISQAQASRTWVSGVGDDANPCSRTAPCKTFAGAISKTAAGGEISVLDPGGFGAVTITKSITINGDGTLAGILSSLTTGVIINAGVNDTINIRSVSINGALNGIDGIRILSAKNVNIENVSMTGFSSDGIEVLETSNVNVSVTDTTIRNCTGAGIKAETSAGIARVAIRNTTITNCGTGVHARRNSRVAMVGSTVGFNTLGVHVEGNGEKATAILRGCQLAHNTSHALQAGGGSATFSSVARLSDNTISNNAGNGVAILANGAVETFLNNEIIGNNTDGCAGCTDETASRN